MYHGTNISNMLQHVEISQVFGANSSDHHSNGVHTALRLRSATNPGAAKGVLRGNRTHQSFDVTKLSRNCHETQGLSWPTIAKPTRL